ncbi:MAG: hypothetical protein ACFCU8_15340 [Thermosynechococcaceae cyanobacterium]
MTLNLKSFRKSLIYSRSGVGKELIADLNVIAQSDAIAEATSKKLNRFTTISVIGLFSTFLIGIFAQLIFAFAITGIFFIALIIILILSSRNSKLNIANQRYGLPKQLIPKFLRDMEPNAPIQLAIDLRDRKHKQKKVDTIPDPRRAKWKIDRYADSWLQMQGQFLDQTRFQLEITEFTVEKYGWKRSRSGKSKFKRKTKPKGSEISLALQFPRSKYGAISILGESLAEAIALPDNAQVKRLKVANNRLFLTVKTPLLAQSPALYSKNKGAEQIDKDAMDHADQLITQMMLSLYHGLNLAKKLSQPTS